MLRRHPRPRAATDEDTRPCLDEDVHRRRPRAAEARPRRDDLLDRVADWGPVGTPAGHLPAGPVRDSSAICPLIARWMNDPAVAEFWELAGPEVDRRHLRAQLDGDGRSVPCLGRPGRRAR